MFTDRSLDVSWAEMPYSDVLDTAAEVGPIAIVPVGSLEQHGHHLPTATDTILAETIAARAAEHVSDDVPVLVTPTVWTGYSPHHLDHGGTVSLSFDTLLTVLEEVAASVLANGFNALLLLNGHGGNAPLIEGATSAIGVDHPDAEILGLTYFDLATPYVGEIRESEPGGMAHGGEFETSLMLHLRPELVREDHLEGTSLDEPYDRANEDLFSTGPLSVYRSFTEYSESGAVGDPKLATAEKGARLCEHLVADLADVLVAVHEQNR